MAYNGSGVYARLYNWVTDRNNTVKIRADRMDAEFDEIVTALGNVICRDGQSTISADIPFNSKKITGLADAAADTDALNRQTADARYQRNAEDLTNITDLADGDEFTIGDASDSGNNKAVLWSVIKSELLAEMTTGFFPSGTLMLFVQTSAPTGWTKSVVHDDKALRVTSGTASSGGTVAFDTAFASKSITGTVGATTLLEADMPSHVHSITIKYFNVPGDTGSVSCFVTPSETIFDSTANETTDVAGSDSSHTHTVSINSVNLDVQYVDVIIATKD
jgi:hypothetical protein